MSVGPMQRNRRLALLGGCALAGLAVAGVVIGLGVGRGPQTLTLPTTGAFAPITVQKPLVANPAGGAVMADPDSMIRQGQDLLMKLSPFGANHRYQLTVTNVSGIGAINSFKWVPPNGVQIDKVLGSTVGSCATTGTTGLGGNQFGGVVANPEIDCTGVNLKAPSCTCKGDGGKVTITFVASESFGLPGAARVTDATPSLNIIPSYPQTPDVPTCAPGHASSTAHPCNPPA